MYQIIAVITWRYHRSHFVLLCTLHVVVLPATLHIAEMGHLAWNSWELLPSPYFLASRLGFSHSFEVIFCRDWLSQQKVSPGSSKVAKPCMIMPLPSWVVPRPLLCSLGQGLGRWGSRWPQPPDRSGRRPLLCPQHLVSTAVICNFEKVSKSLTTFLCAKRPVCFLLQPIYSLNSNSE